ncbi:MAG: VWA domain-containing protein [Thermoleophilia bacterium]
MHASIRLDHRLVAVEGEHDVHVMLELVAPEPADGAARPPLRVALVLDRSGSMGGGKLEVAKRCAIWLAGRLGARDELAVVGFDHEVELVAPLRPAGDPAVRAGIERLHPRGQTNLSGGWLEGRRALAGASGGGPRRVVLLTDGLANVGVTDPAQLVGLAASAGAEGIGTSTIGFGQDFDEDLLTLLADAGGGNAHYADTADAVPAIFAREFEGLTRLVAQNVAVEVRPAGAVEVVRVLNDHPSQAIPGGVLVQLGDAHGGERRRIVLSLHLPYVAALGPVVACELVLRYVTVAAAIEERTLTLPVVVNVVSAEEAAAAAPDAAVVEEVLVLAAARARDEAIRLADGGDNAAAQRVLRDAAGAIRLAAPALPASAAALLAREADELDLAEQLAAPAGYDAASRKRLRYASQERRRGPRTG